MDLDWPEYVAAREERKAEIDRRVDGYIKALWLGLQTHASYGQLTQQQAVEAHALAEQALANEHHQEFERMTTMIALLEIQVTQSAVGMTTAIAALAHLGAAGYMIPEAPEMPELAPDPPPPTE